MPVLLQEELVDVASGSKLLIPLSAQTFFGHIPVFHGLTLEVRQKYDLQTLNLKIQSVTVIHTDQIYII